MDKNKLQKLYDAKVFLILKMKWGSNVKKYENKLEMKETRKQLKGSNTIRE